MGLPGSAAHNRCSGEARMGKYEANIATGKQWLKLAGITLVILFTVLRTRAHACDTWAAMPDATTDHSVIPGQE